MTAKKKRAAAAVYLVTDRVDGGVWAGRQQQEGHDAPDRCRPFVSSKDMYSVSELVNIEIEKARHMNKEKGRQLSCHLLQQRPVAHPSL
jgi:hypothetical protein